ncbi:MAG: hypothetical protein AAGF28_03845 [Pseudomonadota bacterium]
MAECSTRKSDALRTLFEEWGVPIPLLAAVSGFSDEGLAVRVQKKGWYARKTAMALHVQFNEIMAEKLDLAANVASLTADDEKQARALGALAKVIESVAVTATKLSHLEGAQAKRGAAPPNGETIGAEPETTLELDRELAKLLEAAVTAGQRSD